VVRDQEVVTVKALRGMVLVSVGALLAGCSSGGTARPAAGAGQTPSATRSALPSGDVTPPTTPSVPASFASLVPTSIPTIPVVNRTTAKPHYIGTAKDTCPYLSADQVAVLVGVDIETAARNDQNTAKGCSYTWTDTALYHENWVSLSFTAGAGTYGYAYVLKQITGAKSLSGIGSKAAFGDGTMVVLTRDNGVAVIMTVMPDYVDDPAMAEKVFGAAAAKL
jgi:hypothetical protein